MNIQTTYKAFRVEEEDDKFTSSIKDIPFTTL